MKGKSLTHCFGVSTGLDRSAYTLVEVLISIAVIGALLSLLLPAAQSAREAARGAACRNNLRQLGLAVAAFENTIEELPMAAYGRPYAKFPENPGDVIGSIFTRLLPMMDHSALANHYDWNRDWYAVENQPVVNSLIPHFRCPSSPGQEIQIGLRGPAGAHFPDRSAAVTDYTAVYSWGHPLAIPAARPDRDIWGVSALSPLHEDGRFRRPLRKFTTDGASHSLTFVERSDTMRRWVGRTMTDPAPMLAQDWAPWAGQGCVWLLSYIEGGASWAPSGLGDCNINCSNHQGVYSFHPRGSMALFLDGHVRHLTTEITAELLYATVTRSRGDQGAEP
ncbi:MAG: DUF1559 domain-containing protein [Pirellulales bacterium]